MIWIEVRQVIRLTWKIRKERLDAYLETIDWDMQKLPDILHTFFINFQGSGKDILINADIFHMYFYKKSIFDDVYKLMLNRPNYVSRIDNIYANCDLNKEVFGDDFTRIDTVSDIKDCEDGVIYFNDCERWFNSRGFSLVRADAELLDLVNNTRKAGCMMRASAHRFMSIDVKLRDLIPVWIMPDMYCVGDSKKLKDYVIVYKVIRSNGKLLCMNKLKDLPKYCGLYDTLEKTLPLTKGDL